MPHARMAMASSVLFYSSTQSTVSSSFPSSATSGLSRPTSTVATDASVARAAAPLGNSCVAVYAAPSRALLDEHTRIVKEVSRGDYWSKAAAAAATAASLDLGMLVSWDQKDVFSLLIKISLLIQGTYLEVKSLCVQQPDLDASFGSRSISVYNSLQCLTKISEIGIAPHPDNFFVILCMFDRLTELFSLVKQKFLPMTKQAPSTEHITDADISAKFDPTLRALSNAVRRTLELLEVWILGYDSQSQVVPQGGIIHEITRYLMTHIKLLFQHGGLLAIALNASRDPAGAGEEALPCTNSRISGMHTTNGIAGVLIHHMGAALERQSSLLLHKAAAPAVQWLFLGSNMHFVLQQREVLEMMGDDWATKHRDKLRVYISMYLDVSWAPVLCCLESKSFVIPVCFRRPALSRFCLKFEETCRAQRAWKIEDPLLRRRIRGAVIRKLIPTYRSYVERHHQKDLELMNYTPVDLQEQLSDLFEG